MVTLNSSSATRNHGWRVKQFVDATSLSLEASAQLLCQNIRTAQLSSIPIGPSFQLLDTRPKMVTEVKAQKVAQMLVGIMLLHPVHWSSWFHDMSFGCGLQDFLDMTGCDYCVP